MIDRGRNWTRESLGGDKYRQTIGLRATNYRNQNGVYVPLTFARKPAQGGGWAYDLSELFTLRHAPRTAGPMLQFGTGQDLILFDLVNANNVPIADGDAPNEVRYPGAWTGADIHISNAGHFAYIEIRGAVRNRTFEFDITAPGGSFDILPDRIQFKDVRGNPIYHLPLEFMVWDSNAPIDKLPVQATASVVAGKVRISVTTPDIPGIDRLHPTLTLQPDGTDGDDCQLVSSSPTVNYPNNGLGIGSTTSSIRRSPIRFTDMSTVPSTATVNSGTLTGFLSADGDAYANVDNTLDIYRLLKAWIEEEANWHAAYAAGGGGWIGFGASGIGNDRESTSRGSVLLQTTDLQHDQKDIVVDPVYLQNVVDGTWVNDGFLMVGTTEANTTLYELYDSEQATFTAERPKLVVVYTTIPLAGVIRLTGITLTQPDLAGVSMTEPDLTGITLIESSE